MLLRGRGCLGAELAVETADVGTDPQGKVGIFFELDAVAPAVRKDVLSGLFEPERRFRPVCVVGHAFRLHFQALGDVVESGEVGQGLGGLVEVAVDVGAGFVELDVVGEERVEGVEALELEAGQRAYLVHGLDERGAALDAVGMDAMFLGKGHVVVPLLAQAPVAGGRVVELLGQGMHVGDGLQIELGLPVAERVGVMVERVRELANAVMDLLPCPEGMFEAGSVGVRVVGD